MNRVIQTIAAISAAACGFLFGELDGLMYALIAFMILDYISGVLVAIAQQQLSSKVGFRGIAKKVIILVLVAVGHLLDVHVLQDGAVCRMAVSGFYAANEAISILENAGELGIPLPKKLVAVLKQLKSDEEDENEQSI